MEKAQAKTEKELEELKELLSGLKKELGELNVQFKQANGELNDLQHQAQLMEKRLQAASKLITGLTGERTRWTRDVGNLQQQRGRLYGDCILAASFLSYAGAFTTDYRSQMIYDSFLADVMSRNIPTSIPYKLEGLLTTDAVVQVGARPSRRTPLVRQGHRCLVIYASTGGSDLPFLLPLSVWLPVTHNSNGWPRACQRTSTRSRTAS